MIIKLLKKIAEKAGYRLIKKDDEFAIADIKADTTFLSLFNKCKPFSMTSIERLYSLYQSVNYVLDKNIPGDFVECGLWRGGSSMMIALALLKRKVTDRKIYLYDTFEGMSEPTESDKTFLGENASDLLKIQNINNSESIWCYSSLDEVKKNLGITSYPHENLVFVQGKVEDTLPAIVPDKIALLRLDTDWYESTKKELQILYPLLENKGVLIVDDFGHWEGAKKAVLEYFKNSFPFLHRIDNTGRILIKQ